MKLFQISILFFSAMPALVCAGIIDTQPPSLLDLEIPVGKVNVTNESQRVDAFFHFEDDISGLKYINAGLISPSGNYVSWSYSEVGFDGYSMEGDINKGVLKSSFIIPQYAEEGFYKFYVDMEDNRQNYKRLYHNDFSHMNLDEEFFVESDIEDLIAPEILGFDLNFDMKHDFKKASKIDLSFTFSDILSGLNYINFSLFSPSGQWVASEYLESSGYRTVYERGDMKEGTLIAEIELPSLGGRRCVYLPN